MSTPSFNEPTDQELTDRLRQGDESSIPILMARYHGRIYSEAKNITKSSQDAEEITQDVFIRFVRNVRNFRGECSLKSYLYRIVCRASLNRMHYNRRRRSGETSSFDEEINRSDGPGLTLAEIIPDEAADPQQTIDMAENHRNVARAAGMLVGPRAVVYHMVIVEKLSYLQMAQRMGIPIGTVKSRIARMRDELRRNIEAIEAGRETLVKRRHNQDHRQQYQARVVLVA